MTFIKYFKAFTADEQGAVTVDWVVLTAAIVGLGLVVMKKNGAGFERLCSKIVTDLNKRKSGYVSTP